MQKPIWGVPGAILCTLCRIMLNGCGAVSRRRCASGPPLALHNRHPLGPHASAHRSLHKCCTAVLLVVCTEIRIGLYPRKDAHRKRNQWWSGRHELCFSFVSAIITLTECRIIQYENRNFERQPDSATHHPVLASRQSGSSRWRSMHDGGPRSPWATEAMPMAALFRRRQKWAWRQRPQYYIGLWSSRNDLTFLFRSANRFTTKDCALHGFKPSRYVNVLLSF